ncbi:MAG: alkaline phosphatase D family protein [Bacteriovoracales bacterium]|nr:alkaline phosphatase D family protein [Bacteriovoracales bacterium]
MITVKLYAVTLAALLSLLSSLSGCSHERSFSKVSSLAVLQGLTTPTTAQFSLVSPHRPEGLNLTAEGGKSSISLTHISGRYLENFSMGVSLWKATGLQLGTKYTLVIRNAQSRVLDRRFFWALDTSSTSPTIAVASCMSDRYDDDIQEKNWKSVIQNRPDMIFLIGDNVYADKHIGLKGSARPKDLWKRYLDVRTTLYLFKSKRLIPTLAVWDDHDYGVNNGGKHYKYKKEAKEVFEAFYPQRPISGAPHFRRGPGVSSVFRAFNMQWIFLDNRTFRDKKGGERHWGLQQERWLMEQLNSKQKFHGNAIIQGDQFFGGYHTYESFEGYHQKNFTQMMKKIFKSKFPSFFLSGDRHLFELMEIPKEEFGYKTYEVTTSGIHAKVYPGDWEWDKRPNPRQIKGIGEVNNYALLRFHAIGSGPLSFTVQSHNQGSILYEKKLKIMR